MFFSIFFNSNSGHKHSISHMFNVQIPQQDGLTSTLSWRFREKKVFCWDLTFQLRSSCSGFISLRSITLPLILTLYFGGAITLTTQNVCDRACSFNIVGVHLLHLQPFSARTTIILMGRCVPKVAGKVMRTFEKETFANKSTQFDRIEVNEN